MNASYIINDQMSPVPVSESITSRVAMQVNKQDTSNGNYANVDGCGLIVLQVTGTFVAKIIPQVFDSEDTSGTFRNLTAIDTSDGSVVSAIEKAGIYEVHNTVGVIMRARVNSYTSGAVNVDATIIKGNITPIIPVTNTRQELITSVRNKSIAANGEGFIMADVDVSKYAFIYLHIFTDAKHRHTVYYKCSPPEAYSIVGLSGVPITIMDTSAIRDCSEWIELKGDTIIMAITNKDTESSHVYDIDVYGVM